jgi:hypothetical protein
MRIDPISWWTSEVSEFAPIGHVLRRHMHDRWTRFHSLPESKRYAESDAEHQEVLTRHVAVASELFEVGAPIYVYRCRLMERRLKGKLKHMLVGNQLGEKMVRLPSGMSVSEEDDGCYFVRAFATSWTPTFFSALTKKIADWEETGVTFVSPSTKNITAHMTAAWTFSHTRTVQALLRPSFPRGCRAERTRCNGQVLQTHQAFPHRPNWSLHSDAHASHGRR